MEEEKTRDNKIKIEAGRVPMSTTLAMKELLSQELRRNTLALTEQAVKEQVVLEPILTIEHDLQMALSFKVGLSNGKMYVLKNILEFQKAVEEEGYYSYSKKFGFRHTLGLERKIGSLLSLFVFGCKSTSRLSDKGIIIVMMYRIIQQDILP